MSRFEPTLVSIAYSPWSRRAKLALQRQGTRFRLRNYKPFVDEPWLRWRLRRPWGGVTVPVLFTAGGPICDSLAIAYWGSDRANLPLAPARLRPEIERWNALAEDALCAGRLRATTLVVADTPALQASLPSPLPALGQPGLVVGRAASRAILRKYARSDSMADWDRALDRYVETLADALGDRLHLCDEPSYADIVAASGLAFVSPEARSPVPEVARAHWTRPDLVAAFPQLFEWRDCILAKRASA
ncbi:MAG: glutathione S-transferase N-terminal domain-containing protein [Myxococcota bacterium]